MDMKALIESDPRYRSLLKAIIDTPYIERSVLEEQLDLPQADLEPLLAVLADGMLILELAGQADSSLESRVPKKVYLANPEKETLIREQI
jgi:hypothetical protein